MVLFRDGWSVDVIGKICSPGCVPNELLPGPVGFESFLEVLGSVKGQSGDCAKIKESFGRAAAHGVAGESGLGITVEYPRPLRRSEQCLALVVQRRHEFFVSRIELLVRIGRFGLSLLVHLVLSLGICGLDSPGGEADEEKTKQKIQWKSAVSGVWHDVYHLGLR